MIIEHTEISHTVVWQNAWMPIANQHSQHKHAASSNMASTSEGQLPSEV